MPGKPIAPTPPGMPGLVGGSTSTALLGLRSLARAASSGSSFGFCGSVADETGASPGFVGTLGPPPVDTDAGGRIPLGDSRKSGPESGVNGFAVRGVA
jgi:hypothetical protein